MRVQNIGTDNHQIVAQSPQYAVTDPVSNAPDETYSVGTPSALTSTQLAALVGADYKPPFSTAAGVPLFRGLLSSAGGTVIVDTPNRTSQTVTLTAGQWFVQRGFVALRSGGTVTDLIVGF